MGFVMRSERPAPVRRYEKAGRLLAGEDGMIHVIVDGRGEIGSFLPSDMICALSGLDIPNLTLSDSGNGLFYSHEGRAYLCLARQVRGMIGSWPKKKAALFVVQDVMEG